MIYWCLIESDILLPDMKKFSLNCWNTTIYSIVPIIAIGIVHDTTYDRISNMSKKMIVLNNVL